MEERILGGLCIYSLNSIGANSPIFVFHHGAGFTAQTWFLLAAELQKLLDCSIVMYDCRSHGKSASETDLSLGALVDDLVTVVQAYQRDSPVVLVGHSMGGAVVCHASFKLKNIVGTVVVDVVEGTAIESLGSMNAILARRPTSFKSIEDALGWAQENQTRNRKAAEISMPSQLKQVNGKYFWITNLRDTSSFWSGWFTGLSEQFLKMRCARLLILAGTDRLDKTLMIGQMQGKFQLIVQMDSGHAVQEDGPAELAQHLAQFWDRNQPLKEIKRFPIPPKKA